MKNLPLKKKRNFEGISLYVAVTLLAVIGTIFIYSASNYSAKSTYGDSMYFVKKQTNRANGKLFGSLTK